MSDVDQNKSERTLTLCPECLKVLDGWLYPKAGDIYIRTHCPDHGPFDSLYFRDAALFDQVSALIDRKSICHDLKCARGLPCRDHLTKTYNIMLDITQRCNLECPVCFADAGSDFAEPTVEEILERMPPQRTKTRQNAVLLGGEPTLREDLPDLIRGISEKGFIPRLSTNGLRLVDPEYLQTLVDAGLRWVVLQFDGLEDRVYETLRGKPLLADKLRVIENCRQAQVSVQFAIMVDELRNGDQIGKIIDFAFENPTVKWINFYPRSTVNRDQFEPDGGLHVADMLRLFEEQTEGRLRREDFLGMMRLLRRLYGLTGREIFRQKLSTWPMVLIKTDDGYLPLPRLLSLKGLSGNGSALKSVLKNLDKLLRFQDLKMPGEFLFMTMEKFHVQHAVDLCEASCCHMAFMIRNGFVPFDIYNLLYRETTNW